MPSLLVRKMGFFGVLLSLELRVLLRRWLMRCGDGGSGLSSKSEKNVLEKYVVGYGWSYLEVAADDESGRKKKSERSVEC